MEAKLKTIRVVIEGGRATGGPPIGPALGPMGVNVPLVVKKVNELTADYAGLRVPVEVTVNVDDKSFDVRVCTPTMTALIAKAASITKGSGASGSQPVGDISMEQVVSIAKAKMEQLSARDLKGAAKTVLGSCVSMGVTVGGKSPKAVQREIDEGLYDDLLGG
ncbi:TPA: 50S ribosomal protein L11 [Candidatus Bathyarchaeota archaeon]|nr:50S ribosomal protein L11 [Candidatus Bathyarchaeota archaeon]